MHTITYNNIQALNMLNFNNLYFQFINYKRNEFKFISFNKIFIIKYKQHNMNNFFIKLHIITQY